MTNLFPAVLWIALLLFSPLWADEVSTSGDQFTLVPPGAREAAMGGDFSAFSDGAFGVFGNPAVTGGNRGGDLSLSQIFWFAGTNFENLALTQNVDGVGTLGLGLSFYWVPGFDNTGGAESTFSATNYEGVLSYSSPLGFLGLQGLAVGVSGRYIGNNFSSMQTISDEALNWGLYYQTPWRPLKLGFTMMDISLSTPSYDSLPLSYSGGFSLGDGPLLLNGEALATSGQDIQYQGGGEIWATNILAFRLGFRTQSTSGSYFGPSAGIGLRLGEDFSFDYAAASYGDLGLVHWLELGVSWDHPAHDVKPAPTPQPTPVLTPAPSPTAEPAPQPKPVKKTVLKPVAAPIPGFPLRGEMAGDNVVQLAWDPQKDAAAYNVYVSLVPGAGFRKATNDPILATGWTQQTGLHAITFYYQVKAVDSNGEELLVSEVRPVVIP